MPRLKTGCVADLTLSQLMNNVAVRLRDALRSLKLGDPPLSAFSKLEEAEAYLEEAIKRVG